MSTQVNYCGECGVPLPQDAAFCGKCGTPVADFLPPQQQKPQMHREKSSQPPRAKLQPNTNPARTDGKSKITAILLGIFLGGLGAHKFYMGSWGWGIIYLLTCWLLVPFLVALVEWIRYLLMSTDEFNRKAETFKDKGPFGFFW